MRKTVISREALQDAHTQDYLTANNLNLTCCDNLRSGVEPKVLKGITGLQRRNTEDLLSAFRETLMPTKPGDKIVSLGR